MVARTSRKSIRKPRAGRVGRGRRLGVTATGFRAAGYGLPRLGVRKRPASRPAGRLGRQVRRRFVGAPAPVRTVTGPQKGPALTYRKVAFGKNRRLTMSMMRKMCLNDTQLRAQGVNRLGSVAAPAVPGFHSLQAQPLGVGVSSLVPLHIYELTNVNNTSSASTGSRPVGYFTNISDTGAVGFSALPMQNPAGVSTNNQGWAFESSDAANSGAHFGSRYIRQCWLDIRLLLHGCTQEPATFDVMVFSIAGTHTYIDPATNPGSMTTADQSRRNAFWQSLSRAAVVNPIMPGTGESLRGIKVWRRYRVNFQPEDSGDRNDEPDCKSLKIFIRDGRVFDYDDGGSAYTNDTDVFATGFKQEDQTLATQYQDQPAIPARMYLLIRALNTTQQASSASRTTTPSYDIVLRKKIEFVKSNGVN